MVDLGAQILQISTNIEILILPKIAQNSAQSILLAKLMSKSVFGFLVYVSALVVEKFNSNMNWCTFL